MKTNERVITATEFKAKCLRILDQLNGQSVVITKRGRPIARIMPVAPSGIEKYYGCMKGKIKVKGNIFSTGVKWDAES
jgi:prevent-host-death family protein